MTDREAIHAEFCALFSEREDKVITDLETREGRELLSWFRVHPDRPELFLSIEDGEAVVNLARERGYFSTQTRERIASLFRMRNLLLGFKARKVNRSDSRRLLTEAAMHGRVGEVLMLRLAGADPFEGTPSPFDEMVKACSARCTIGGMDCRHAGVRRAFFTGSHAERQCEELEAEALSLGMTWNNEIPEPSERTICDWFVGKTN